MRMISSMTTGHEPDPSSFSEERLVALARSGDEPAIRAIVQRNNRRLFRTARAIVRNDAEAEDVVQATYVQAFTKLDAFRGDAQFSTWLTRIALNDALSRLRQRRDIGMKANVSDGQILQFPASPMIADPEAEASRSEARRLLERAVDELPEDFRAVFVLREIEGMSTEETASYLDIRPETAKTRLHRARRMMRASIEKQLTGAFSALFPFDGSRCVAMADWVIAALNEPI